MREAGGCKVSPRLPASGHQLACAGIDLHGSWGLWSPPHAPEGRRMEGARGSCGWVKVGEQNLRPLAASSLLLYCFLRTAVPFSPERMTFSNWRKEAALAGGISTWRTMYSLS